MKKDGAYFQETNHELCFPPTLTNYCLFGCIIVPVFLFLLQKVLFSLSSYSNIFTECYNQECSGLLQGR